MAILGCVRDRGTELNKLFEPVFEQYLKLLIAVNANSKILFVTITAKLMIQIGSIVRNVLFKTGLRAKRMNPKTAESSLLFRNSWLFNTMSSLSKKLQSDYVAELTVATRLSTGVWPPPDSYKNMVYSAKNLILGTARLIDMANGTGLWTILEEPLSLPNFKVGECNPDIVY
jgi:hypothetical protein